MGKGDAETAARRLRLLQAEFLEPTRGEPGLRTGTRTSPPAPLHLGILDHMKASVEEVIAHTRQQAPNASPIPAEAGDVYDWCVQQTPHLDGERQAIRDALIFRQSLEHAIAMGDIKAVRKLPCPGCGCYGLLWRAGAALCPYDRCTDSRGMANRWSLAQLAHHHVAFKKMLKTHAT
ncbi:hypothetical protein ACFQ6Q_00215 [Streptomyces sp. NPDC056437]|uniref:hypothetical protein n=1 Tax=Streptomyces sp. NPDC056437 TaxID=3345816 RepID=UPI0036B32290